MTVVAKLVSRRRLGRNSTAASELDYQYLWKKIVRINIKLWSMMFQGAVVGALFDVGCQQEMEPVNNSLPFLIQNHCDHCVCALLGAFKTHLMYQTFHLHIIHTYVHVQHVHFNVVISQSIYNYVHLYQPCTTKVPHSNQWFCTDLLLQLAVTTGPLKHVFGRTVQHSAEPTLVCRKL